jgi:hypothetical protein
MKIVYSILAIVLLSTAGARSQELNSRAPAELSKSPSAFTSYPNLETQAKEFADAYVRNDNDKFLELSYPKWIEKVGKQKLLAEMLQGEKELQTDGVEVVSWTPRDASEVLSDSGTLYAVVPTTMRMKKGEDIGEQKAFLVAVSSDEGCHWTFVSRNCIDLDEMFPQVANKLKALSGETGANSHP